jgi:uncharacterized protein (DUF885 family)
MRTRALAVLVISIWAACGSNPAAVVLPPAAPAPPVPVASAEPAARTPPAGPDLATRRKQLADLLDETWEYRLQNSPELASAVGDHRYDDRWSDRSLDAIAADNAKQADFLARFEAIDTAGFPEQEALNEELMVRRLREYLDNTRFEGWLMPVSQMSGPPLDMPQLPARLRFDTALDYEHYLTRLHAVAKVLDQVAALMQAGVAKHLVPPRILLVQCVTQARALARGKPADNPFAAPVTKFPDGVGTGDRDRLRAAIVAAVKDEVMPAYAHFADYLEHDYVPQGRADPGEWALPDGDARYAADVRRSTTTDLTPAQIHQIGLDEVARIERAETELATKLGFATLDELRKHVRTDKKLYAKDSADILARYNRYVAQMYDKLPMLFGRLPRQHMLVKEVEAFRAKAAAGAEYQRGAPDGSRPGVVRVNTSDPTRRLTINMESTAYHEGVPGHHLQVTIQQELGDLPKFRQQGGYNAYAEGWALYAERLGEEVGFYQDPWSMYGHLEDEMLRAIRLVVDTGFHADRWTRDQVVTFFHDHSAMVEPEVQAETDRYIAWPGQALGYKIGQLTILRLRGEAQAALGAAFDVRAFHDEVLGAGALPMDVLERRVHAWIEAKR